MLTLVEAIFKYWEKGTRESIEICKFAYKSNKYQYTAQAHIKNTFRSFLLVKTGVVWKIIV